MVQKTANTVDVQGMAVRDFSIERPSLKSLLGLYHLHGMVVDSEIAYWR